MADKEKIPEISSRRFRFGPDRRLRKSAEFAAVFESGKKRSDARLLLYALPNRLAYSRLGLAVGKKLGSAVRRNRYKRLLREAFRLRQYDLPAGYDYVLIPKPKADTKSRTQNTVAEYSRSLTTLAAKIQAAYLNMDGNAKNHH